MASEDDKIKSLLFKGSQIVGAAAGGITGYFIGGPLGASVGGPLGLILTNGLSEMTSRVLSDREETRIGATAIYAIATIKSRLEAGDKLRTDGFFEKGDATARSDAEEVFEGVLMKAKNEHEEKKTKILGNIFANAAFTSAITIGQANHALKIAEGLTYCQMCLLSLITVTEGIELGCEDFGRRKKIPYETMSLLQQLYELYSDFGLIIPKNPKVMLVLGWHQMAPQKFGLSPIGERYYQLMGIEKSIPDEDVRDIARHFQLD